MLTWRTVQFERFRSILPWKITIQVCLVTTLLFLFPSCQREPLTAFAHLLHRNLPFFDQQLGFLLIHNQSWKPKSGESSCQFGERGISTSLTWEWNSFTCIHDSWMFLQVMAFYRSLISFSFPFSGCGHNVLCRAPPKFERCNRKVFRGLQRVPTKQACHR